jgi:electron transport complex protein RnfG
MAAPDSRERRCRVVDIIRLTLVLTLISVLAAGAIALTNRHTEPRIRAYKQALQTAALRAVLPSGVSVRQVDGVPPLPARYWVGERNGATVGYAFQDSSRGYVNEIQIIVGVDPLGVISGMKIISQNETPGLGNRIAASMSAINMWKAPMGTNKQTDPWFTRQFIGINAAQRIVMKKTSEWHLLSTAEKQILSHNNTVTAITGASVSSRAVVQAITQSIPKYIQSLSNAKATP